LGEDGGVKVPKSERPKTTRDEKFIQKDSMQGTTGQKATKNKGETGKPRKGRGTKATSIPDWGGGCKPEW